MQSSILCALQVLCFAQVNFGRSDAAETLVLISMSRILSSVSLWCSQNFFGTSFNASALSCGNDELLARVMFTPVSVPKMASLEGKPDTLSTSLGNLSENFHLRLILQSKS